MNINTVTVLGANGTMGSNISAIFASFGNAKVYMVARDLKSAEKGKENAILSIKAESIRDRLVTKTYDDLEEIIPKSDLIFESVSERFEVKRDVYQKIKPFINKDAIIASGTSGLSIDSLSDIFDSETRKKYFGVHFFNPPYSLTLCELIPNRFSSIEVQKKLEFYLKNVLYRDIVICKDYPAFLGNLIGFQFMNHLLIKAEKYKDRGGIDYIDAIFTGITGRNLAPLFTINFVGLDVHKAIVDNVYLNTDDIYRDSFVLPEFIDDLISNNHLGLKSKRGLYARREDRTSEVYDISSSEFRDVVDYDFKFVKQGKKLISEGKYRDFINEILDNNDHELEILKESLVSYVVFSLTKSLEICSDIHSADVAMATGFGWIPPLSIIDAVGGKTVFKDLIRETVYYEDFISVFDKVTESKYDYRSFIKAR